MVTPRLSAHKHTGRHLRHAHTSYAALVFVLFITGILLIGISATGVHANAPGVVGNDNGQITIFTSVPGLPPTVGATIASPIDNQRFTSDLVPVRGSCKQNLIVRVYKNDILAASTYCTPASTFSAEISLFSGKNILKARNYDAIDQAGPETPSVVVYSDYITAQGLPQTAVSQQLLLYIENKIWATSVNAEFVLPVQIIKGTAPYAIAIDWGDGTNDLQSQVSSGGVQLKHTYKKVGQNHNAFDVVVRGTDANGISSYVQTTIIVTGISPAVATSDTIVTPTDKLAIAWPIWGLAAFMVLGFWAGEIYMHRKLLSSAVQRKNFLTKAT
jgi:hypothetical protein